MILNEKGMAIPLVLMVMVVIIFLGSAAFIMSMTNIQHVTIEENKMQAYYLSKSGAELAANNLDQILGWGIDGINVIPDDLPDKENVWVSTEQSFEGENLPTFLKIKVYKELINTDQLVAIVESKATIGNTSETLVVEINDGSLFWRK